MVFLIILSLFLSKWMFAALLLIVVILGLTEFYGLLRSDAVRPHRWLALASGILWYCLSAVIAYRGSFADLYFLIVVPLPFLFIPFLREVWSGQANPLQNVAITNLGLIYIVWPMSLLPFLYGFAEDRFLGMPAFLLGYLLITWVYDTGAYLFGSLFGRKKFFERISPKKTWEGTLSGALAAALVAAAGSFLVPGISRVDWAVLLLLVLAFGTIGDLVESLFKRSLNIKDSGSILPGHGGILDRFDSLFISAPFVFLYFFIRNGI